MSHQKPLAALLTTVLGAAIGGLILWRSYRTKRRKLPPNQEAVEPAEPPAPQEKDQTLASQQCPNPPWLPPPPPAEVAVVDCQSPAAPPAVQTAEQLPGGPPVLVSCAEEWQQVWPLLQTDLGVLPALGLDCEWVKTDDVTLDGRAAPVSLLQLSSCSGACALLRLPTLREEQLEEQRGFPGGLEELLADPRVLKVGVGCYEDGKRLTRDYGLTLAGTLDLRHLALRHRKSPQANGLSLKSLAADLLDVCLDKSLTLRCSDWEAEQLTPEQMTYAARDAQVSLALFLHLLGLRTEAGPALTGGCSYPELASRCQGLVDVPFRGRGDGEDERRRSSSSSSRARKQTVPESPESGDQQVPDPRRNRRKPLGVGYSVRKSPLYDNCFLYAPDGQPLCTCDRRKAKWYLDKGIGVLQSEEPFIVRLLFEPSGRPDSQHDYYLTKKENLCVVCGKADSYIRKNIVPHEYRRHFPTEMKDHNSHDILLLCTACHAASNLHDGVLKQQLAEEHAAPLGCEDGVRLLEDPERRRVRSAARALLSAGDGLPARRRDELQQLLRTFLQLGAGGELGEEELQRAANLETRILNDSFVPHGLKVVRACARRGLRGLMDLERRWRQHFLTSMRPRHLPSLWCVDHNHSKFLRKYGADLPIKVN